MFEIRTGERIQIFGIMGNDTEKEIKTRIGTAKKACRKQKEFIKGNLNIVLKKKLLNLSAFSVLSYLCES